MTDMSKVLENKVVVNGKLYLDADNIVEHLKEIFSYTKDGYIDEALNELEYDIDSILEETDFLDGEE